MTNLMKKALLVMTLSALAAPALSAGYLEIEGVKGEARATSTDTGDTGKVKKDAAPKAKGLLLPAVQHAQPKPATSSKRKNARKAEESKR